MAQGSWSIMQNVDFDHFWQNCNISVRPSLAWCVKNISCLFRKSLLLQEILIYSRILVCSEILASMNKQRFPEQTRILEQTRNDFLNKQGSLNKQEKKFTQRAADDLKRAPYILFCRIGRSTMDTVFLTTLKMSCIIFAPLLLLVNKMYILTNTIFCQRHVGLNLACMNCRKPH